MLNEVVDILIIGAGASSAAAVYSLSSLNVKILCLEQGDWMNSSHYPSNYKDWQILRNYKYNQGVDLVCLIKKVVQLNGLIQKKVMDSSK